MPPSDAHFTASDGLDHADGAVRSPPTAHLRIDDADGISVGASGCTSVNQDTVDCGPASGYTGVSFVFGAGNDMLAVTDRSACAVDRRRRRRRRPDRRRRPRRRARRRRRQRRRLRPEPAPTSSAAARRRRDQRRHRRRHHRRRSGRRLPHRGTTARPRPRRSPAAGRGQRRLRPRPGHARRRLRDLPPHLERRRWRSPASRRSGMTLTRSAPSDERRRGHRVVHVLGALRRLVQSATTSTAPSTRATPSPRPTSVTRIAVVIYVGEHRGLGRTGVRADRGGRTAAVIAELPRVPEPGRWARDAARAREPARRSAFAVAGRPLGGCAAPRRSSTPAASSPARPARRVPAHRDRAPGGCRARAWPAHGRRHRADPVRAGHEREGRHSPDAQGRCGRCAARHGSRCRSARSSGGRRARSPTSSFAVTVRAPRAPRALSARQPARRVPRGRTMG